MPIHSSYALVRPLYVWPRRAFVISDTLQLTLSTALSLVMHVCGVGCLVLPLTHLHAHWPGDTHHIQSVLFPSVGSNRSGWWVFSFFPRPPFHLYLPPTPPRPSIFDFSPLCPRLRHFPLSSEMQSVSHAGGGEIKELYMWVHMHLAGLHAPSERMRDC